MEEPEILPCGDHQILGRSDDDQVFPDFQDHHDLQEIPNNQSSKDGPGTPPFDILYSKVPSEAHDHLEVLLTHNDETIDTVEVGQHLRPDQDHDDGSKLELNEDLTGDHPTCDSGEIQQELGSEVQAEQLQLKPDHHSPVQRPKVIPHETRPLTRCSDEDDDNGIPVDGSIISLELEPEVRLKPPAIEDNEDLQVQIQREALGPHRIAPGIPSNNHGDDTDYLDDGSIIFQAAGAEAGSESLPYEEEDVTQTQSAALTPNRVTIAALRDDDDERELPDDSSGIGSSFVSTSSEGCPCHCGGPRTACRLWTRPPSPYHFTVKDDEGNVEHLLVGNHEAVLEEYRMYLEDLVSQLEKRLEELFGTEELPRCLTESIKEPTPTSSMGTPGSYQEDEIQADIEGLDECSECIMS